MSNFATYISRKLAQDLPGMQGTTRHSCSEEISLKEVLGSSHFSLSRITVLHHHQAEHCLLTHSSSFTSRKGRCETPSRSLTPCVVSLLCLSVLAFLAQLLYCCFLTALTPFSATTSAGKHTGSFSDQIWHRGSLLPPVY